MNRCNYFLKMYVYYSYLFNSYHNFINLLKDRIFFFFRENYLCYKIPESFTL